MATLELMWLTAPGCLVKHHILRVLYVTLVQLEVKMPVSQPETATVCHVGNISLSNRSIMG